MYSHQILEIDEDIYREDEDMMYIIRKLQLLASDPKLRHDMNVEDEYFSAIENRDTEILLRDKQLAEQGAQLKEQGAQLKEQVAQLKEQGAQLKEQGAQLKEQGAQLKEQGVQLKEKDEKLRTSVRMLLDAGVEKEVIAVSLGITVEEIDAMK